MNKTMNKYSPEVRERAVRMVLSNEDQHESRWSLAGRASRSDVPRGKEQSRLSLGSYALHGRVLRSNVPRVAGRV